MGSPLFPNWGRKKAELEATRDVLNNIKAGIKTAGIGPLKFQVSNAVLKKLGPLGGLIEALLKPFGKSLTTDINKEIDAAAALASHLNEPEEVDESIPMTARPQYHVGGNTPDNDDWRQFPKDEPVLEGMINVKSSNVHSIGYLHPQSHSGNGDLLVRFLAGKSDHRQGKGALYRYRNVEPSIWKSFKTAASAGKFVWDELRIRGTVSGHQYSYDLEEVGRNQHIPRQAGLKPGRTGEFYIPRMLGKRRSTLPERQVRGARGTLPGWRGQLPDRRMGRK